MGLIVKHADGSEFLNIENKTYDNVSTSLKLPGKGVLNWGEAYVNNFVHLLENFASASEPTNPQVGQIWYNTGNGTMAVYTTGHDWEVINKDADIEQKFNELVDRVEESNAGTLPPENAIAGNTWFDTNINVFKIYDGAEWRSFGVASTSSFLQPSDPQASDLWFDKNVDGLRVHDGDQYQRLVSTIESVSQPQDVSVGQWWTNTTTGNMYVYAKEPSTNTYYWKEVGADDVTEGDVPPAAARTGALHITRTGVANILYVNKGTKLDPVWTEVPEFGGAIKSVNEPARSVDGMFWLDGNDVLKVKKSGVWVDIDETAISYISDEMPAGAKDGMVWFDTLGGVMKIKVGTTWENVQSIGLIEYGNAPVGPIVGQLWYQDTVSELNIWNGDGWEEVSGNSTIVALSSPVAETGQFWLNSTTSELNVRKDGRWAPIPENARAFVSLPSNPVKGDIAYVDGKLKVWDGTAWKDINIQIDNSSTGSNVSINYDEASHEIVIAADGIVTRVPLAVNRDVIVENVGITSDIVEVIKPDIKEGERRIIDINKVNLDRQFFVFKNGLFTDNWSVDTRDLILHSASGDDEIDVMQFNGDVSINYLVKKFRSNVSGSFTINNYTRTEEEQAEYDIVKAVYDTRKEELIVQYERDDEDASEDDLTAEDWAILEGIEATLPVKESNQIADLSLGSLMVFKEGVFIPAERFTIGEADEGMTVNQNNENNIVIPNTNVGEIFTIVQLIAGSDYKTAFFSKEYSFTIGEQEDNTESTLSKKGTVMDDLLQAASNDSSDFGMIDVSYDYNSSTNIVTFDLIDVETDYHFFVTRNNLFVSPTNYTINTTDNTLTMYANDLDEIRFFQFYLPHNYVPVEFNYKHGLAAADGWITLELNREFDLEEPLLVFRNGLLQQKNNVNIITQETIIDDEGLSYTVNGLRKVQVFGDYNEIKTNLVEPIKPDEPVIPEKPKMPIQPEEPEEPVAPAEPVAPLGGVAPADLVEPTMPTMPTEPTAPVAPVAPVEADFATIEEYNTALATYETAMTAYNAEMVTYDAAMVVYNSEMSTYNSDMITYNSDLQLYNDSIAAWNSLQEPVAPTVPVAPTAPTMPVSTDYVVSVPPVAPVMPVETNYETTEEYNTAVAQYTIDSNQYDADLQQHEEKLPVAPVEPVEPIRADFPTEEEYNAALNSYLILKDLYTTEKVPEYEAAVAEYEANLATYYSIMDQYHADYETYENDMDAFDAAVIHYNDVLNPAYSYEMRAWQQRVDGYNVKVSRYEEDVQYYDLRVQHYNLKVATFNELMAEYSNSMNNYTIAMANYGDALDAYNTELDAYAVSFSAYLVDLKTYDEEYLVFQNLSIEDGIRTGDIITIMQVSQPEIYHIYLEEFGATTDDFNLFNFVNVNKNLDFLVFRNGMRLTSDEYYVNQDGKLVVSGCNGPTVEEFTANPNATGDDISVYQFFTKDTVDDDGNLINPDVVDLSLTEETITATQNGFEYFQLINTNFIEDEFLLVFKNGQLITRRQDEDDTTTQDQINTYLVFAERVYHNTSPALDPTGEPIIDEEGEPVINIDPDDYTDITAFSLDNVVVDEEIEIFQFNKKVTNVNSLTSISHYEIMPTNNIQRIYTNDFMQLTNLTMVFQDGLIIDRSLDNAGGDTVRTNGMLRLLDQYAVDNTTRSIIVNDWKVGGKLKIQQFTAAESDIRTVTLTVNIAVDGTKDIFLPNNQIYSPMTGALEVYVDKVIQWSGDDYTEVANNRINFASGLNAGQVVKIIVRT